MATYLADRMADKVQAIAHIQGGETSVVATFTLTAALALNDTIQMCTVPLGAVMTSVTLYTSALDSGTNALRLAVGDSNSSTRYIAGAAQTSATVGMQGLQMNNGGVTTTTAPSGPGYIIGTNTGDTTIIITVSTGPGTGATAGTIVLVVTYSMEAKTPIA